MIHYYTVVECDLCGAADELVTSQLKPWDYGWTAMYFNNNANITFMVCPKCIEQFEAVGAAKKLEKLARSERE